MQFGNRTKGKRILLKGKIIQIPEDEQGDEGSPHREATMQHLQLHGWTSQQITQHRLFLAEDRADIKIKEAEALDMIDVTDFINMEE